MGMELTALNQELMVQLKGMFADDLSTGGFMSVSTARMQFGLRTGGDPIQLGTEMDIIVAAEDNEDHCVYYANSYDGTAVAPDAVWYRSQKAPAIVPQSKLVKDASNRYGYAVKRRVVCLVFVNGKLNPSPVVFDISGQSLYKNAPNGAQFLSYTQYRKMLASMHALPVQVVTHCTFDPTASVSVIRFSGSRPATADEIKVVMSQMDQVRELVHVQTKGDQPEGFKADPEPAPQPAAVPFNANQLAPVPKPEDKPAADIKEPPMDSADAGLDSLLGDI